jgi:beta-lactamase regulating signal transducer with metallopeptidase domain
MPAIETWLQQPAAQAVGWALLQFVWQGTVIGALTALALLALRRSASDVRYIVATIGLALMLTLPVVTGVQKYQALRASAAFDAVHGLVLQNGVLVEPDGTRMLFDRLKVVDPEPAVPPQHAASSTPTAADRFVAMMPAFLVLWICGVSVLTLRLLTGWMWVQRLRRRGVSDADEMCRHMAARLARRLHITRAVTLLESRLVDVPTVIGFLEPVVLLPAAALAGLSAQQIEAILAHELAHIRRHDYVVNLLQTLVETVLFYHPAVWWVSRRIRIERENCCDDLAVNLCGDPVAYATALADLEALRSSGPAPERHIAMAATGGSLLQRVRRLLGAPSSHSGRGPAWLAAIAALSLIGCVAYSADDRPVRDPRLVKAVDINKREIRELGRMLQTEMRAARMTIRGAALTLRQSVKVATRPRAAAAAIAEPAPVVAEAAPAGPSAPVVARPAVAGSPAPVLQPGLLPAIAEASARVPVIGSLPSTIVAAVIPLAPVGAAAPVVAEAPQSTRISEHTSDTHGNWIWSNNGDHLEVTYSGKFEFTDDDTDVRVMSPGGSLKISDGKWLGRHSVEIRERGGQLEHLYYVNASSRPYEPEGRVWLQQNLPRFVRNTGIGAESRVARLLKSGGPGAVLTEIGRIDGNYVKGIYYKQLFAQATLTPDQYRQAMTQAGREMKGSSYELAQLLIAVAGQIPSDEASRAAYFQAAGGIDSDYELRRVYTAMLKRGPVSSAILAGILANSRSIDSDYELSELLRQLLSQQSLDDRNRTEFFAAVGTLQSSYERHRVLSAAVSGQAASDPALLESALTAATGLHSNYETAQFLQEVLRQNNVEGRVRAPFFAALNTIDGNYDKGRVLQAVVRKSGTSPDTLRAVLQSSRTMDGYELSQLLQAIAGNYAIAGDLREAYLTAADRLGNYDQSQAMAALVRSERRK